MKCYKKSLVFPILLASLVACRDLGETKTLGNRSVSASLETEGAKTGYMRIGTKEYKVSYQHLSQDKVLIGGDMLASPEDISLTPQEEESGLLLATLRDPDALWAYGIIPFKIDESEDKGIGRVGVEKYQVIEAMLNYHFDPYTKTDTGIRFLEITHDKAENGKSVSIRTKDGGSLNYQMTYIAKDALENKAHLIVNGLGDRICGPGSAACASYRTSANHLDYVQPNYVYLSSRVGDTTRGLQASLVHELAHTLSFIHEHQRSDRDQYIKIHWEKVPPALRFGYTRMQSARIEKLTPYDYESVTHYNDEAITRIDNGQILEPQTRLSRLDYDGLRAYKREVDRFYPTPASLSTVISPPSNIKPDASGFVEDARSFLSLPMPPGAQYFRYEYFELGEGAQASAESLFAGFTPSAFFIKPDFPGSFRLNVSTCMNLSH